MEHTPMKNHGTLHETIARDALILRTERRNLKKAKEREKNAHKKLKEGMEKIDKSSEIRVQDKDGDVIVKWGPIKKDPKNASVSLIKEHMKLKNLKKRQKMAIGDGTDTLDCVYNRFLSNEALKCLEEIGASDQVTHVQKRARTAFDKYEDHYLDTYADDAKKRTDTRLNIFVEKNERSTTRL